MALSRSYLDTYSGGSTSNDHRVMNMEFYHCTDVATGARIEAIDGIKKGMSELYNQLWWMDGWQLTV